MRRRMAQIILVAVAIVVLLMGIPGALVGSALAWSSEQNSLDSHRESMMRAIDRRQNEGLEIPVSMVEALSMPFGSESTEVWVRVTLPDATVIEVGDRPRGAHLSSSSLSALGTGIRMEVPASDAIKHLYLVFGFFAAGSALSIFVGWILANRLSRRLSAPLIYLSAQAEQIGSGMVRAQVKPSGIEEIDLVQEELVRTGEKMAGRLAAERQFAADASHQLRTPLTALSMRLEEIEMISDQDEIRAEAEQCLEQVERLTNVISDLLDVSRRSTANTEAVDVLSVLNTAREEWEDQFKAAGRTLTFTDESEVSVLAEEAKLGHILATLIENSLRYGSGGTRVVARSSSNRRGVMIDVSDEGTGVEEQLATKIFEYGVSGHESTGIGLGLARDLAHSMGGRLELVQNIPPIFTVSLAAIPSSMGPDQVMPEGPMVSLGRRSRHL